MSVADKGSLGGSEPEKQARATDGEGRVSGLPPGRRRLTLVVLIVVVLVLATALVWGYALLSEMPLPGFELSSESVAKLIRSWGAWGIAATIGLMVVHSFVPFPAEFVAVAAGMVYGPLWGSVITWVGAMCGAMLSFGLAKLCGRPLVRVMVRERHWRKIDRWTESQGASTLLAARLIPVIAFNLINYAAGLTSVSWWTFIWTTGLGIIPLTVLMVTMGDQMRTLTWDEWGLFVLFAIGLWLAIYAFRRRRIKAAKRS
jgi:uncharacterized membrane protein YdjX (TVP38/TMEM64 family)